MIVRSYDVMTFARDMDYESWDLRMSVSERMIWVRGYDWLKWYVVQ